MKKYLLAFGILAGSVLGVNNIDASAEANNTNKEENSLFINLKAKNPDWTITQVTADEVAKIKEELLEQPITRGPAPPVTALYIDQVASQLGTINEYYEDIGLYQRTSHAVEGIAGVGVLEEGYGNDWKWLGSELITYTHPDYIVETASLDFNNDRIIDGFYHAVFFDSDAKITSGTSELYKFKTISQNSPWNTMEKSINIPHK